MAFLLQILLITRVHAEVSTLKGLGLSLCLVLDAVALTTSWARSTYSFQ